MKKLSLFIVVMCAMLALTLSACVAPPQDNQTGDPIKIGVMLPLSGDAASYGLAAQKGIDLAAKEVNQRGILPGPITLIYEDSKCDPAEAVTASQKLIVVDGVHAIIGELCSSATLAAVPIAEANNIVLISPASTTPSIKDAGDYIFRTVPSDALQGAFGAELVSLLGYGRLAILYSNEDYGIGFKDVLEEEFLATGKKVKAVESFERTATDVKTQLTKIKSKRPDAVYLISNSPTVAGIALKQMKEINLKAQVFGSEGLKDSSVVDGADGGAEGMILTTVSGGNPVFTEFHRRIYDETPGPFAAQGYDAVKAIAEAIVNSDGTRPGIKNALYTVNFKGASGHIVFDVYGEVEGNYEVFSVVDGEFVPFES